MKEGNKKKKKTRLKRTSEKKQKKMAESSRLTSESDGLVFILASS